MASQAIMTTPRIAGMKRSAVLDRSARAARWEGLGLGAAASDESLATVVGGEAAGGPPAPGLGLGGGELSPIAITGGAVKAIGAPASPVESVAPVIVTAGGGCAPAADVVEARAEGWAEVALSVAVPVPPVVAR